MKWFDAGVNLTDDRLDAEAVITDALAASVQRLCVITTHPDEWQRARELHAQFPQQICYTLGVHPHHAKDVTEADFTRLRDMISLPGVVALGECGLDFNRNFSPQDTQIAVFKRQLSIAAETGKPVYLHERDAFDTQCACLKPVVSSLSGGIAHCFTQGQRQLDAYLEMGLYIGITGWVCDPKRGDALRQCIPSLPLDKLILETDAPYLFPKSLRPRQRNNTPSCLPHIGEQVASLYDISPAQISASSYANTCRLFGMD
ncbi:TatD family hydrolase [Alteromonas halophila]|uniref:DNase TatD n=1 Tax=Alteromonas halophila TaxID=516698 RepID=A0A918JHQ4_9ALTE|nr:TatD family hydrolase [Alteromonas halophila]GGW79261.1 DNase TatD [Alteromonas halophila]